MIEIAAPFIGDEERSAVDRVLRSGQLSQGPEVAAFEADFASIVDGRHCIAVNSGTSALHVACLAVGFEPGDEVIVPSFTFAATANAVAVTGARPVFADLGDDGFDIDPSAVEAAVTERTAGIIAVDLYGHPARLDALEAIADRHGLALIEDAAQAHGASLLGRPCGAWGDLAAFSFYPTKNMTAGEGGMVTTADAELARRCRLLRNQGMEQRYRNEIVGLNLRMTDIAAAIGRVQLSRLVDWNAARRRHATSYAEQLAGLPGVATPSERPGAHHVYHQYTLRVDDRDGVVDRLRMAGIGTAVYYPTPVHRLPAFSDDEVPLPQTERAAGEVVSIPVHPMLSDGDVEQVARAIVDATAVRA